jgi:hypothetical protein
VAALLAGHNSLPGQTSLAVPAGMQSRLLHTETNGPYALNGFAKDPFTEHFYLSVYNELTKVDAKNTRTVLHKLPKTHIMGLVAIPAGSHEIFFTDFNNGDFFRRHVLTGKQVVIKGVVNTFDVAVTRKGEVLVVANPKWPARGATSGIWLMDTAQGKHREVIQLAGPSGPLVLDAQGNLLYALQPSTFPAPKGSVKVIRFPQSLVQKAIQGGKPLTISQATVVLNALDGALDLAFDDRQRLYISDPQSGGLRRTLPATMTLDGRAFMQVSRLATLWLQFVERRAATFDGFQPGDGGELYVATTDWQTTAEVWQIQAVRPVLSSDPTVRIPKGPMQLSLRGAPGKAAAWLVLSASPPRAAEIALFYDLGVPGWVGLDLQKPHVVLLAATDATGSYQLKLQNPGGTGFRVHLQALAVAGTTPTTRQVGTSNVLALDIEP